ncbi:MAG: hypothetical protein RML38_04435 [Bacteroidia bacterium]|nr:hypothetical protein [Bacteroidia bacterium]
MGVSLHSCPQGRRAAGCAIASVLRPHPPTPWAGGERACEGASHRANARPPHASRTLLSD